MSLFFFFFCHKPEQEIYGWGHSDFRVHLSQRWFVPKTNRTAWEDWLCCDPLGLYSLWLGLGPQAGMKGETKCAPSDYTYFCFPRPNLSRRDLNPQSHVCVSSRKESPNSYLETTRQNNFDQQIHVESDLAFCTAQIHSINVYLLHLRDGRKGAE